MAHGVTSGMPGHGYNDVVNDPAGQYGYNQPTSVRVHFAIFRLFSKLCCVCFILRFAVRTDVGPSCCEPNSMVSGKSFMVSNVLCQQMQPVVHTTSSSAAYVSA